MTAMTPPSVNLRFEVRAEVTHGLAVLRLNTTHTTPTDVPRFAYTFTTPGMFVQDDVDIRPWLAMSMSGRLDHHSQYGLVPESTGVGAVSVGRLVDARVSWDRVLRPLRSHRRNRSGRC